MGFINELAADVTLPNMVRVKQHLADDKIPTDSIAQKVQDLLAAKAVAQRIVPGKTYAVTCGSRGIANLVTITRAVVDFIKSRGATPLVVGAMGSHGGATEAGQKHILQTLGVTEETMGCAIDTSMETVHVGNTTCGKEIHIGKAAYQADGIFLCNRIKPHTSFRGRYESGLMKMLAIGLPKQKGAEQCHEDGFEYMAENVALFGGAVLQHCNVIAGLGIIENALDETAQLHLLPAEDIPEKEPLLLKEAFALMPQIYLDDIDVLIVDETGKNISGDGMDPNITGTFGSPTMTGGVNAQRVAVLDLTDASQGSAVGIGMAHAITRRFFDKISFEQTYPNLITTKVLEQGRIPMVFDSDKETIQIALRCCLNYDAENPRIVRIKNTLKLDEIYVSEALLKEVQGHPKLQALSQPQPFAFNADGNLF